MTIGDLKKLIVSLPDDCNISIDIRASGKTPRPIGDTSVGEIAILYLGSDPIAIRIAGWEKASHG